MLCYFIIDMLRYLYRLVNKETVPADFVLLPNIFKVKPLGPRKSTIEMSPASPKHKAPWKWWQNFCMNLTPIEYHISTLFSTGWRFFPSLGVHRSLKTSRKTIWAIKEVRKSQLRLESTIFRVNSLIGSFLDEGSYQGLEIVLHWFQNDLNWYTSWIIKIVKN